MTSIMWGPSAEVLDPRAALHADDVRTERVEVMLDQVDDETGGVDWDDPSRGTTRAAPADRPAAATRGVGVGPSAVTDRAASIRP